MKNVVLSFIILVSLTACTSTVQSINNIDSASTVITKMNNPIVIDKYTADPAALVYKDKVYIYAGHDVAPNDFNFYKMNEWLVYSSSDMKNWQEHPVPLKASDFKWATGDAWASQVIENNGKFYWYVTVTHNESNHGKAIGIGVSDSPTGPFTDALGKALITNDMTKHTQISWDDIDPTVFTDDDGQTYLYWGNIVCHYVKLNKDMLSFDGEIQTVSLPHFTEAPWIHKHKDWYYLSYAYQFPEKIAYAMSKSITGPWEFKGILNEVAGNSNTNHQAIIEFKGQSYFIYHNGSIPTDGGSFRRSVCVDKLFYNKDGTMKRVIMTSEGIQ